MRNNDAVSATQERRTLPTPYVDLDRGAWSRLREWVQHYAGLDLRWDVELTLAADHVPEPRLGGAVRLGVSTWIGRRDDVQRGRDRNDLRLRPDTSFLLRRNTGVRHA
jgi:hypothetical protein